MKKKIAILLRSWADKLYPLPSLYEIRKPTVVSSEFRPIDISYSLNEEEIVEMERVIYFQRRLGTKAEWVQERLQEQMRERVIGNILQGVIENDLISLYQTDDPFRLFGNLRILTNKIPEK